MNILFFWLFFFLLGWLTGCSSPALMDAKVYYKQDMLLNVNNVNAIGTLVAQRADSYKITITSLEDMDLLQISTCGRDVDVPGAINGSGNWFNPKRTYAFTFTPNTVEKLSGCVLKLGGYNKSEGQHSWAFIAFEDPKFTLPAGVSCNAAADYTANGVTVCQTLQHLFMQIWFSGKVVLSTKSLDRCQAPASQDGGVHWIFQVQDRECIYEFMEIKAPYRRHQLITVGYESVPIRVN